MLVLIALVLTACSGDDDGTPRAAGVTTTTTRRTTTTAEACPPGSPPPTATDGSAAEVVAKFGDVQIAIVDRGASVDVVSLFAGCAEAPVQIDGATAALPVGGTVTHGDGIRCTGDRIVVLSATSDDGKTYQAKATTYRLEGTRLVAGAVKAATLDSSRDTEALRAYYELDC